MIDKTLILERQAAVSAARRAGESVLTTAEALGVSTSTVYADMRALGLPADGRNRARKMNQNALTLDAEMAAAYADGETLGEIGERYGVSRERVRQRIKRYDETFTKDVLEARRTVAADVRRAAAEAAYAAVLAERGVPCVVCGAAFVPSGVRHLTCKSACAETWVRNRHRLEGREAQDRRRLQAAEYVLRYPERHPPSTVKRSKLWVALAAAGQPLPPPSRRFKVPGSMASLLLQENAGQ